MNNNNNIRLEGCGCRYRTRDISDFRPSSSLLLDQEVELIEHICDTHMQKYLQDFVNHRIIEKVLIEKIKEKKEGFAAH